MSIPNPPDRHSYQPIADLKFNSGLVQRVATLQFLTVSSFQNAICLSPLPFTEAAVSFVYSDLLLAAYKDHIIALVLVDLSRAFVTV
jgi:hypothetical protein